MSKSKRRSDLTLAEAEAAQEKIGPCGSCGIATDRRIVTGPYAGLCLKCAGKARLDRRSAKPCVDCGSPALRGTRRHARHRCDKCDELFCDKARASQSRKTGPCPNCGIKERHVGNTGEVKTYCEECHAKLQRARWRENREKYYGKQLESSYGIKYSEYLEILSSQGGICPICLQEIEDGKNTVVDHCHDSLVVRGVIHRRCNSAIGMLGDDSAALRRAADYIDSGGAGIQTNKKGDPVSRAARSERDSV